jgi:hypothetical protein
MWKKRKYGMGKKSLKLEVTNSIDTPLSLFIEPWGRDYTMLPGETFELVMEGGSDSSLFNIRHNEKRIEVYAESGCLDVLVFQNGKELSC